MKLFLSWNAFFVNVESTADTSTKTDSLTPVLDINVNESALIQ